MGVVVASSPWEEPDCGSINDNNVSDRKTGKDPKHASRRTFTTQQVQDQVTTEKKLLMIIQQRVVDVTSFANSHPGGSRIFEALAGSDATDAFFVYHPKSTHKLLPHFTVGTLVNNLVDYVPSSPASSSDSEKTNANETVEIVSSLVEEYRELNESFIQEGLYETSPTYYIQVFARLISILACAVCLTCFGASTYVRMLGAIILGHFLQQVAFVGHDLGHNSLSHNRKYDSYLGYIWGPLLSGISLEWWKASHNLHHVAPNSVDFDINIQHAPVMAIDKVMFDWFCVKKRWNEFGQRVTRFLLSHQDVTFYPFLFVVSRYNLYIRSLFYLLTSSNKNMINRELDFICLVLFHTWIRALLLTLPNVWEQILFMILSHAAANIINLQIVLSHFPMPVYRGKPIVAESAKTDMDRDCWFRVQVMTTLNVDCPAYMDWFHGGLQFQIEHHLWPRLPRHNLRRVQARTQELCRRHGVPYHSLPFGKAVWSVTETMNRVARDFQEGYRGADKGVENDMNQHTFMDSIVMKAMSMEG